MAWGCIYDAATHSSNGFCWKTMLTLMVVYLLTFTIIFTSSSTSSGTETDGILVLLGLFVHVLALTMIIITASIRGRIRRKYNIRGSCCGDCIYVYCFGCCTAIQAYQQLETSHEQPKLIRDDECDATLLAPQVV